MSKLLKNAVARPFFHARAIYHVTPDKFACVYKSKLRELRGHQIVPLASINLTFRPILRGGGHNYYPFQVQAPHDQQKVRLI